MLVVPSMLIHLRSSVSYALLDHGFLVNFLFHTKKRPHRGRNSTLECMLKKVRLPLRKLLDTNQSVRSDISHDFYFLCFLRDCTFHREHFFIFNTRSKPSSISSFRAGIFNKFPFSAASSATQLEIQCFGMYSGIFWLELCN